MKLKMLVSLIIIIISFSGCSSPQRIILKDNTVLNTKDEVKYNRKTGFYEYEDLNGRKNRINSDSIFKIEEL